MSRAHNFSAGPAVLPESVIAELQAVLPEFGTAQAGIMEISHRSKDFDAVILSAEARLRRLLGIPDDYSVLFLQGGASLQFYMLALNLAGADERLDYIHTGVWSAAAVKEAARVCDAVDIWTSEPEGYNRVPSTDEALPIRDGALALHYTSNNTVAGTQYSAAPNCNIPLIGDLSSDICSRPVDVARHALIYAGAQKNLGPSGVTAVVLSPWALERSKARSKAVGGLPSMLDYALMVKKGSMFNTPNTFGIYALERVLAWMESLGGVDYFATRNRARAARLYGALDATPFYEPCALLDSRSDMNVTWRLARRELEPVFLKEATAAGLLSLKGHRSVGGIRASLYNALPDASVDALVSFLNDFAERNA